MSIAFVSAAAIAIPIIIFAIFPAPYLMIDPSISGAIVGDSWRYAGIETLHGSLANQACPIMSEITGEGIPCVSSGSYDAQKYVNDKGDSAYLLESSLGEMSDKWSHTETYVVVINSHVYCVATNSTLPLLGTYNECQKVK